MSGLSGKSPQKVDIEFEVLLARPPIGKFGSHIQRPNFEEVEEPNNERNIELWKKWEEVYSFPNDNLELVREALQANWMKSQTRVELTFLSYVVTHIAFRGWLRYNREHKHAIKLFKFFSRAKYAAFFLRGAFMWANSYHWYNQSIEHNTHSYMQKRVKLLNDSENMLIFHN